MDYILLLHSLYRFLLFELNNLRREITELVSQRDCGGPLELGTCKYFHHRLSSSHSCRTILILNVNNNYFIYQICTLYCRFYAHIHSETHVICLLPKVLSDHFAAFTLPHTASQTRCWVAAEAWRSSAVHIFAVVVDYGWLLPY